MGFEECLPPQSHRQSRADETGGTISTSTAKVANVRPRSPSDPFLDTPTLSHSIGSTVSGSPPTLGSNNNNENNITSTANDRLTELPATFRQQQAQGGKSTSLDSDEDNEGPFLRVWTVSDLSNPELQALISLFPDFIARHALPRFPLVLEAAGKRYTRDIEAGLNAAGGEHTEVSCGTGRILVGRKVRSYGWQGSWWQRFTGWWRRLFGC